MGDLSNSATDIVSGLRVLRGIGGEQVFLDRYRRESQTTRRAGVEVAKVQSVLDALQVFLPGVFVVVVVWLGARAAATGSISPGELVAFYGYSAFLMIPLRTATEYANKVIRARVAARRICRVLALTPDHTELDVPAPSPAPGSDLYRRPHRPAGPGGHADRRRQRAARRVRRPRRPAGHVRCRGRRRGAAGRRTPAARCRRDEVRRRIVVSDTGATLFSGRLGDRLDVLGTGDVDAALATASADDIFDVLPDGLDTVVDERGRSFSGGQRQRLVLARALTADPEILVLVEPTSAVDAHTEARIAARLRAHRAGRTTVVTSTSPLVLDAVDEVAFLRDGRVVATGRHVDLLDSHPVYRAVVTRETEPAEPEAGRGVRMSTALPVADSRSVRRYAASIARRHPRLLWTALALHVLAAVTALAAPRLLGDLVEAVETAPPRATSTGSSCSSPGSWSPRRSSPASPATSARCWASRCWPSCARTSSPTPSASRSASSSRPAPATCSPAPAATSSSSAGRCGGRCRSGRSRSSPPCSPSGPRSASAGGWRSPACSASRRW